MRGTPCVTTETHNTVVCVTVLTFRCVIVLVSVFVVSFIARGGCCVTFQMKIVLLESETDVSVC